MLAILYVDDEPDLLEIGKLFLERSGDMSVTVETDARAALERLRTTCFDTIISDYQMPGIDGITFLQQVRGSGNDIPFILFTGRGREEVVIEAINSGANFYLQKGGDPESQFAELMHKIRQAVQRKTAEDKYKDVFENATEGIFQSTPEGRYISVNPAFARISGYLTPQELIDAVMDIRCQQYVNPEDRDRLEALLVNTGRVTQFETEFVDKAGRKIWVSINARPVYGRDGRICYFEGTVNDITERKRTQAALSAIRQQLPLHQFINPDNRKNGSTAGIDTGSPTFFDKPCNPAEPPVVSRDIPQREPADRDAMAGPEGSGCNSKNVCPPGNHFCRNESEENIPCNEVVGLLKIKKELQQAHARNEAFMAANPDLQFILSYDGRFIDCHTLDESILLEKPERFIGRYIQDFLPQDITQALLEKMSLAGATGALQVYEYSLDLGGPRFFEARIVPAGETECLIIIRDITQAKHYTDSLKEAVRRTETLVRLAARLNATLDIDTAIKEICRESAALFHVPVVSLYLYDPQRELLAPAGFYGLPPEFSAFPPVISRAFYEKMFCDGTRVRVLPDVRTLDDSPARDADRIADVRTIMAASMMHNGALVGMISLVSLGTVRTYTDDEKHLIAGLADQAALVITNARLFSEQEKIKAALSQANKKLSLLNSITHHDIINRLTVLRARLRLAKKRSSNPEMAAVIQSLDSVAQNIYDQLENIHLYQQIGLGLPCWQNLSELLDKVKKEIDLPGICISTRGPTREILADPLLEYVIFNLVENAVRHGKQVTHITLSTVVYGETLVVSCEDDGDGIPSEFKERIFDRGVGSHTGMGLFLAREILSITGIRIAENGIPGTGARFDMTIPPGMWREIPARHLADPKIQTGV